MILNGTTEAHENAPGDAEMMRAAVMETLLDCIDLHEVAKLAPEAARAQISTLTSEILTLGKAVLSAAEATTLAEDICNELFGLGPLQPYLARDDVTDIMVNGTEGCFAEIGGRLVALPVRFASLEKLTGLCQRLAAQAGRRVDEASPVCDARLPGGSRINIIFPPLAISGPVLTIRTFRREPFTLKGLQSTGQFCCRIVALLELIAACRCNLLITGGSGSGKTTLAGALTGAFSKSERVILCEDAAELRPLHAHTIRLETRPRNFEGQGEFTMTDLVRNALRMRPDRIIVGEVRGGEALDMLQAMNTGHDGSIGTLHANSPEQALKRLEAIAMLGAPNLSAETVRGLIAGGIDLIIHLARGVDGARRLVRISEIRAGDGVLNAVDVLRYHGVASGDAGGWQMAFADATGRLRDKACAFGMAARLNELLLEACLD